MHNKFLLSLAWACAMAGAVPTLPVMAQVKASPSPGAPPSSTASPATSTPVPSASAADGAWVYRSPGSPLTVGELASLQRKKLEQDYYKKMGMTPIAMGASQAKTAGNAKTPSKTPPKAPPRLQHQLVILGIYGPAGAERVELRYDGITHVATGQARIGLVTLESLAPGSVQVLAQHAGTASRHTLRPGETLEVSQ